MSRQQKAGGHWVGGVGRHCAPHSMVAVLVGLWQLVAPFASEWCMGGVGAVSGGKWWMLQEVVKVGLGISGGGVRAGPTGNVPSGPPPFYLPSPHHPTGLTSLN
ncbi:hypothetical protein BDZ94DRAFT_1241713 [Collybia nuda]|uniref:Uncharacterized protein n=1 Tax=Collybia nuda TaxID=64659 RepID=A0A9P6CBM2_9AGAR|nr:hypothetical protein BDZ94DRAFT_1241713 [Collybia nuda]